MRHVSLIAAVAAVALAAAIGRATSGAVHGPGPAWALFSFAVSAFRGPLR
ncbi:hypothetical protein [Lichenibacterium minor]|nr:hypothetical protein [Lichenibacterium minor]